MKKFAAINIDGFPTYTAQGSSDDDYFEGQTFGEGNAQVVMREFDFSWNDANTLNNKFYEKGWHDIKVNPTTLDGMTLKNLPIPSTITIDGVAYECTDEEAELEFVYPSTYTVVVTSKFYKSLTFKVTV
jgi:hypothetical protein